MGCPQHSNDSPLRPDHAASSQYHQFVHPSSLRRTGYGLALVLLLAVAAALHPSATQASAANPQAVVHSFCREDALGARTAPRTYRRVADVVGWPVEPAWDHVVLIRGYEVGDPQPVEPGVVDVPVSYTVVGRITATRYDVESYVAERLYRVLQVDGAWRIAGPPPPPHLFANRLDPEEMQRALAGAGGYLSQSRFVAEILRAGGWPVALETVPDLVSGGTYGRVRQPRPGDLAVFLDGGQPYHVGIVEAPGRAVSATLSGRIVRSTLATFPGTVGYLRLIAPAATSTPTP